MSNLELQVAALARLATAEDKESQDAAKAEILNLMKGARPSKAKKTVEDEIRQALLELGVPDNLIGHKYLIQGIDLAVKDLDAVRNMTKCNGIYHRVAKMNDSTPSRVERGMRHCIEVAWVRGDVDVFDAYFGNTISVDRGKPTTSEFISRLANVIRSRLKEEA